MKSKIAPKLKVKSLVIFLIAEPKSQQVWFITYKWLIYYDYDLLLTNVLITKVPLTENCSPLINESVDIPIITSCCTIQPKVPDLC